MKNKILSPEHKEALHCMFTDRYIYLDWNTSTSPAFLEIPALQAPLASIITIVRNCRSIARRENATRIGRSSPERADCRDASHATDRNLGCKNIIIQIETTVAVLQLIHEASAQKNDTPQGNSATNAADTTSGLHGYSCRSD